MAELWLVLRHYYRGQNRSNFHYCVENEKKDSFKESGKLFLLWLLIKIFLCLKF